MNACYNKCIIYVIDNPFRLFDQLDELCVAYIEMAFTDISASLSISRPSQNSYRAHSFMNFINNAIHILVQPKYAENYIIVQYPYSDR